MPRIKPTTVFTPRTKPNTQYTKPRDRSQYPVSFDSVQIRFDSLEYTFDATFENLGKITTIYNTPRYGYKLQDILGSFVQDLLQNDVQSVQGSGGKTLNITTNWI